MYFYHFYGCKPWSLEHRHREICDTELFQVDVKCWKIASTMCVFVLGFCVWPWVHVVVCWKLDGQMVSLFLLRQPGQAGRSQSIALTLFLLEFPTDFRERRSPAVVTCCVCVCPCVFMWLPGCTHLYIWCISPRTHYTAHISLDLLTSISPCSLRSNCRFNLFKLLFRLLTNSSPALKGINCPTVINKVLHSYQGTCYPCILFLGKIRPRKG